MTDLRIHVAVDGDPSSITPRPGAGGDPFLEALRAATTGWASLTRGPSAEIPRDAEVVVGSRISPEVLADRPALRAILVPWAGIPGSLRASVEQAKRPDLDVLNIHHNAASAAETAIGLLLSAARGIHRLDPDLRRGDWSQRYLPRPSRRLEGSRGVVLGRGAIGSRIERGLRGLGMETTTIGRPDSGGRWRPGDLADRVRNAAVLMIAIPSSPTTDRVVDAMVLDALPDGIVVNVGRGAVVDEQAMFERLRDGRLFAAGLDVWWRVPTEVADRRDTHPSNLAFHELDNVAMTPHVGGGLGEPGIETARAEAIAAVLQAWNSHED